MPLPKTKYPIMSETLPSSKKKINFRQMIVQDEKILLVAKASEDAGDIFRAVKQVVNNCILDDIDIDSLTTFDIEYMFLRIRAVSIGNVIEIIYRDSTDEQEYKFIIDLDDVAIHYPEDVDQNIPIGDDTMLVMKYPPASLFDDSNSLNDGVDGYEYLASQCIDKIFDGDDVYHASEVTQEERVEYIEGLDTKSYAKVKAFLSDMPRLKYTIDYSTKDGTERKLELNTLTDFFTFW